MHPPTVPADQPRLGIWPSPEPKVTWSWCSTPTTRSLPARSLAPSHYSTRAICGAASLQSTITMGSCRSVILVTRAASDPPVHPTLDTHHSSQRIGWGTLSAGTFADVGNSVVTFRSILRPLRHLLDSSGTLGVGRLSGATKTRPSSLRFPTGTTVTSHTNPTSSTDTTTTRPHVSCRRSTNDSPSLNAGYRVECIDRPIGLGEVDPATHRARPSDRPCSPHYIHTVPWRDPPHTADITLGNRGGTAARREPQATLPREPPR